MPKSLTDEQWQNPSAGMLVKQYRWLREHPEGLIPTGCWPNSTIGAEEWRAWFVRCIMARCNRGLVMAGRKWDDNYQHSLRQDERMIHDYTQRRVMFPANSLRVPELQARFQWSYSYLDGVTGRFRSGRE